jgi:hypothetical protein
MPREVSLTTFELNILIARLLGTYEPIEEHMVAIGHEDQKLSGESLAEISEHIRKCAECGIWADEIVESGGEDYCDFCSVGFDA